MANAPTCSRTRSESTASPGSSTATVVSVEIGKSDRPDGRPYESRRSAIAARMPRTDAGSGGTEVIRPSPCFAARSSERGPNADTYSGGTGSNRTNPASGIRCTIGAVAPRQE